jgi:signal transduction histidine kinase
LITIHLEKTDNKVMLNLTDDGTGFNFSKIIINGIGLSNMKKRTEMLGGNFEMQSSNLGTKLAIALPL